MDNNKLEFVQHFLFYDLDELTEIDLSHNKISFVHPHAFGKQNNLMVLKLNSNNLHTINPSWFAPFDKDTFSVSLFLYFLYKKTLLPENKV